MAVPGTEDQFFMYEDRLSSFLSAQQVLKRRASNASSRAPKSLKWPHSFLPAEKMAKAGFFFYPLQGSLDNTKCFLCKASIDGWEHGDDPLVEHLTLSPDCGWAVVASIDARDEVLSQEYPMSARMIEARKATFGDRWPLEGKKGWKCKVKQMVDAGWKYTPTSESDDMATCVYCELALDGWEPSDKPLEEHFKRSPDCAFFTLVSGNRQVTPKRATKSRKPRASKASRLSTQSALTVASEAPSLCDITAENEDSIVTSTIVTPQRGRKMAKGKKAGAGRKTRAKKDEPTEVNITGDLEAECGDSEAKVEKPKSTRSKKRASEAIDESSLAIATQQHPSKRRTTRTTRASVALGDDVHVPTSVWDNVDMEIKTSDIVLEKRANTRKKGRGSTAKPKRNFSSASTASKASLRMHVPDDDEIERALQEDLERPLTDEEDNMLVHQLKQPVATASLAPVRKTTRVRKISDEDHDMFGVEEIKMDEAEIEAELEAMEAEESIPLPKAKGVKGKQGRKPSARQQAAAVRRAAEVAQTDAEVKENADPMDSRDQSVQSPQESMVGYSSGHTNAKILPTRGTGASAMSVNSDSASLLSIDQPSAGVRSESANESDTSIASQATIVRTGQNRRGSTLKSAKAGKKVTSKHIEEIVSKPTDAIPNEQAPVEKTPKKRVSRLKKVIHAEEVVTRDTSNAPPTPLQQLSFEVTVEEPTKNKSAGLKEIGRAVQQARIASGAELARQTTPVSPKGLAASVSPQSSDAENHPPSKPSTIKPLTESQSVRIPLLTSTPTTSPSRRNGVAGLQTTYPWTAVDLDDIFLMSPSDKENTNRATSSILTEALGKAKKGNLTSPERKMTVEEWIIFNAGLAEEKLRGECEQMVGVFEKEGGRAMGVLEGIECLD